MVSNYVWLVLCFQLGAIHAKYEELERDYRANRNECKQQLETFTEEANKTLVQLTERLKYLRTEISNSHVV